MNVICVYCVEFRGIGSNRIVTTRIPTHRIGCIRISHGWHGNRRMSEARVHIYHYTSQNTVGISTHNTISTEVWYHTVGCGVGVYLCILITRCTNNGGTDAAKEKKM